ncbi:RMD5 protein [Trichuris trichiura]|uniref:RMD5 protein n=1 Tax=Trichuris trichiura TaxID=36087 RepID=A0A077Z6Y1_TRITR|nr:RMD5 protein [Trichuris trichiura]
MEGVTIVEEHVDRLLNKYAQYIDAYCTSLDSLNRQLDTLHRELIAGTIQKKSAIMRWPILSNIDAEPESTLSVAAVLIFEQFLKRSREVLQQICSNHRDMHASVSKVGREIEKVCHSIRMQRVRANRRIFCFQNFVSNLEEVCMRKIVYEKDPLLRPHVNLLLAKHYLSMGLVDIADELLQHSGVQCDVNNKTRFTNMYKIVDALKNKDITPALEYLISCAAGLFNQWAELNKEKLERLNSNLGFYLARLQFVQLIEKGCQSREKIMEFAKRFHRFANTNTKEMQVLMASMVFMASGLESSPYNYLLSDNMWDQAIAAFTSDWCKVYRIPTSSPLSVIIEVGIKAVTAMLNLRKVMRQGKVAEVLGMADELPVEVDMAGFPQYHSVFACPILRQPTTEANPPVRLVCGHVISKDAVNRLVSHDRSLIRCNGLKCPYCPQESHISKTKVIYF